MNFRKQLEMELPGKDNGIHSIDGQLLRSEIVRESEIVTIEGR